MRRCFRGWRPRLPTAGSAPCDCRARFRAAFRWLLFWAPAAQIASGFDRFRGCSALTASNGFLARRCSAGGLERGDERRGARRARSRSRRARREEKRREGKSVAFVPLVDGAPGWALASLGLGGSYRSRGLRPHPAMDTPPRVVSINSYSNLWTQPAEDGRERGYQHGGFFLVCRPCWERGGCEAFGSCHSTEVPLWCGSPPLALLLGSMKGCIGRVGPTDPSET